MDTPEHTLEVITFPKGTTRGVNLGGEYLFTLPAGKVVINANALELALKEAHLFKKAHTVFDEKTCKITVKLTERIEK